MTKFLFTSLVKGERYEQEFAYLNDKLTTLGQEHIKHTPEVFNFNEKVNAIRGKGSKVILIDTDHVLNKNIDFESLNNLDKGIHVKYSRSYLIKDTIEEDIDTKGYFELLKEHYGNSCINFLDESIIIFNLEEDEMKAFIEYWDKLIELTKNNSPFRFSDTSSGALEGCLISIAAKETGITIYEGKPKAFFDSFYHYGPSEGHRIKITSSVV